MRGAYLILLCSVSRARLLVSARPRRVHHAVDAGNLKIKSPLRTLLQLTTSSPLMATSVDTQRRHENTCAGEQHTSCHLHSASHYLFDHLCGTTRSRTSKGPPTQRLKCSCDGSPGRSQSRRIAAGDRRGTWDALCMWHDVCCAPLQVLVFESSAYLGLLSAPASS
ncbi:hypothetical protein B0H16DRAFT_744274 [Mycena metata]|uniref:Secreted protein n=1 Tax=Mycena metata TaxID=1033252 RepID=A0AAD7NC08_9AGAR|nr:hypothetical protein B0H16DRAFT_744274 [Mycena metata]